MERLRSRLSADGDASESLAFVMGLPLLDGVFATLVVAGALDSTIGVLQVGLLVFGGAATAALLLSSERDRRSDLVRVLKVGAIIAPVAAVQAALAPTFTSIVDPVTFRPFAGLVLLAVAARVASAHVRRYLPAPGLVVLAGVIVSFQPSPIVLSPDLSMALAAVGAAGVGIAFALAVVATADRLHAILDTERFRFGSAVALGTMGASVAGVVSLTSPLPLIALVLAGLLALDPGGTAPETEESDPVKTDSYP